MSEELDSNDASVDQGADNTQIETTTQQPTDAKPAGYDPVDFETASPEEIRQRHDYLYRQIKDQKRTEKTLREYREITAEQSRRIEELTSGVVGVVNHLQDKSFSESETSLTQQMQVAFENGNTAAYIDAQNKLIELKADKRLAEQQRKAAPKQEERKSNVGVNANEIAMQGLEDGDITQEDANFVNSWQDERDESGQLLRPWAHTRNPQNPLSDPVYAAALRETVAVLENQRFAHLTMDQKMAEVDRRMGVSRPASRQTVMGGNLTSARKSSKVVISPKQQEIAVRTKFGGPKAKSDADHIEAYRKQIEQSKKGAR